MRFRRLPFFPFLYDRSLLSESESFLLFFFFFFFFFDPSSDSSSSSSEDSELETALPLPLSSSSSSSSSISASLSLSASPSSSSSSLFLFFFLIQKSADYQDQLHSLQESINLIEDKCYKLSILFNFFFKSIWLPQLIPEVLLSLSFILCIYRWTEWVIEVADQKALQ